ncbi:MAG: hypothetical protein RL386_933 [Bacteroidota bacterium]
MVKGRLGFLAVIGIWLQIGGIGWTLQAQPSAVLDEYVQMALSNSLLVQQELLRLEADKTALEHATRLNLPELRLGSSYTLAEGGRRIIFPVGDLLNPVYSTLNALTRTNNFPQIENVNEQFLPNNFYDLRFRAVQPLLNAEIRLNRQIRGVQVTQQEIQVMVVKRTLVKEVKVAYFRYLQSMELSGVYENTLAVLRARKRINETYVRNGVALPTVLLRDDGEIARMEDLLRKSGLQAKTAAALLNYLLGRELETPVISDPLLQAGTAEDPGAVRQREELARLQEIRRIQELLIEREKALSKPQIGAQLDFGSQNFDFKWGGYALLGISLDVPIWNAGRQNLKVQEARINADIVGLQANDLENALELEVFSARKALETARSTQESYRGQLPGARRYLEDLSRRYREGGALYLELLDAQTQLTNLETQEVISKYEVLVRHAELERALAAYSF